LASLRHSRTVYVPSGVSSFFEICDREPDGSKIKDNLRAGSRGGGFIIKKGNLTTASTSSTMKSDSVTINGKKAPEARTTLKVIELMRRDHGFAAVRLSHKIDPPIGQGFGTSGSGAIATAIALGDLFHLNLSLSKVSAYAHSAEIESVTGLGTVISLISGAWAIGLVTEPGSFSIGRVDGLVHDYRDYTLICAFFGPIEKSRVLSQESKRDLVNRFGRQTLEAVLQEPTPESLLRHSRLFAERTGLASAELLKLADKAVEFGAIGSTQNMIGNAVHCLVLKKKSPKFLAAFSKLVPRRSIFESELSHSGPRFV
jgi:pantoate kinase